MDLSIIIPVYNVKEYLKRCFDSINHNSDFKYEIIFVNDGSTDGSLEIIEEIALKESNVVVISQVNQGLSVARNTGIKNAVGKYFILLDSDDWLNFHKLEKLLSFAEKNELDLLSYRLESFDENYNSLGLREKHPIQYNKILSGRELLSQGYQPSSSCLFIYKRDFIIENKLTFYPKISQQDVEFTIRLMTNASRVFFSDEVIYNYYRHLGTISMPKTKEKLEKYLSDSIIVSGLIKQNKIGVNDKEFLKTIEKNYNSVVWNLLFRFLTKPKETDFVFKNQSIQELKLKGLYPIKGKLKTSFQNKIRFFFNSEILFKLILKIRS